MHNFNAQLHGTQAFEQAKFKKKVADKLILNQNQQFFLKIRLESLGIAQKTSQLLFSIFHKSDNQTEDFKLLFHDSVT